MRNCSFENSSVGVIIAKFNTTMLDIGSIYTLNTFSTKSSTLLFINGSIANFVNCRFYENFAKTTIIHTKAGTLTLRQCELTHNKGKGLVESYNNTIMIYDSNLSRNFVFDWMLFLQIKATNLSIDKSTMNTI